MNGDLQTEIDDIKFRYDEMIVEEINLIKDDYGTQINDLRDKRDNDIKDKRNELREEMREEIRDLKISHRDIVAEPMDED